MIEAGDVAARASEVCSHGVAGYCADDALPEEREAIDFLHRHAYDWALAHSRDRDLAERYAAWMIHDSWRPGVVLMEGSHSRDWERFISAPASR